MYEDLKVLASIVTVRQTSQSNGKKSWSFPAIGN